MNASQEAPVLENNNQNCNYLKVLKCSFRITKIAENFNHK